MTIIVRSIVGSERRQEQADVVHLLSRNTQHILRRMSFVQALNTKEFVVTARMNLAEVPDKATLLRNAEIVGPSVDAVQLPDSTQIHISGIAAAAILIQHGVDPIIHMNCRDRNRIALQKDLAGAAALGVTSVLIKRGKKLSGKQKQDVRAVFDIPALELIAYIQEQKQDEDDPLNSDFIIGANAEVFDPDPGWQPKNLIRKCEAGVNFVQTQICFDADIARNYMAKMVASKLTHKVRFLLALAPLPSAEAARWVRDNIRGAVLPERVIDRMEKSSDPEREGIDVCAELMCEMAEIPGVAGVNLLDLGNLHSISSAVAASGLSV